MPDSPSAASTAAAAAMASGKHCPPRITHDSGDFLVLHGKFGGANKGFGEAPKSCTRKEHESATNSIAKRGQGGDFVPFRLPLAGSRDSVPCGVWGNAPTVPRPTNPKEVANKGAGSEASLPVTLRVSRRASKLLFPPRFREKTFFLPASCRFPAKSLNPSEFFFRNPLDKLPVIWYTNKAESFQPCQHGSVGRAAVS